MNLANEFTQPGAETASIAATICPVRIEHIVVVDLANTDVTGAVVIEDDQLGAAISVLGAEFELTLLQHVREQTNVSFFRPS